MDITTGFAYTIAVRLAHTRQSTNLAALPEDWRVWGARLGAPAGLVLAEAFTVLEVG
jgi:hypothetical protein